jgi:hypothetical protein
MSSIVCIPKSLNDVKHSSHSPPTTPYNAPSYQQTTSPSPPPDIGHGLAADETAVVSGTAVAGYYNQLRQLTTTGEKENTYRWS